MYGSRALGPCDHIQPRNWLMTKRAIVTSLGSLVRQELYAIMSISVVAVFLVASTALTITTPNSVSAATTGDDYPAKWKNIPMDSVFDTWGEYNRECTSAVAWWLHERNGFEMPFYADAGNWKADAQARGYSVTSTPAVGAVAWTTTHVAWVESVNSSAHTVTVEEYNEVDSNGDGVYGDDGTYSQRTVASSSFQYIHFKDITSQGGGAGGGSGSGQATYAPSYLSSATNADGRIEVFAVGTDNKIYSDTQSSPNTDTWAGWNTIPAGAKSVTATTESDGRIAIFYVGGDNALYYRTQSSVNTESWSAEHRIQSGLGGPVAATRNADGRIALIAVGTNNKIEVEMQSAPNTDSWTAWYELPAGAHSITATVNTDGRIEILYVGGDGAIWYRTQTTPSSDSWSAEERIPSGLAGPVSSTSEVDGRIALFADGTDNKVDPDIQTAPSTDAWNGWYTLPAGAHSITATVNADGRIEVLYIGGDGALYSPRSSSPNTDSWSNEESVHAGLHV